ncbi:MAG: hypothetical protein NTV49_15870, partial [Kiritimatiellaeota bacterium]|nr:hypothetical protein [Kiritimatiellota bacterium]
MSTQTHGRVAVPGDRICRTDGEDAIPPVIVNPGRVAVPGDRDKPTRRNLNGRVAVPGDRGRDTIHGVLFGRRGRRPSRTRKKQGR